MKRGHVIRWNGDLYKVTNVVHVTPGNKRAHFQTSMKSLSHGRIAQNRFAAHDDIEFINVEAREMQYLYREGDHHVFMDNESYEQVLISDSDIADEILYIKDNAEIKVNFVEDKPISLDLPAAVELKITETDPGLKGDSVSNVFKPAKLETGLEIKVPLYIGPGDTVKVDTRTGEFQERAQQAK
jgi:elongation factor P